MATVYTKQVIDTALSEVGYKADGKYNKYAKTLDAVNYYNTKKNGYADFCAIFFDYCVYMNTDPKTADNARSIVFEPNKDNCGAGCTQKVAYYKAHNAYYTKTSDACCGDQVFFKKSDGTIYHTGIVVDWDAKGIYTVEANTNGGRTEKKFYKYSDTKIAGFGRPKYTAWEKPKPEPTPEPKKGDYDVKTRRIYYEPNGVLTGEDVKTVQKIIGAEPDGQFGKKSRDKLIEWQKANGLEVTGEFDRACWDFSCGAR